MVSRRGRGDLPARPRWRRQNRASEGEETVRAVAQFGDRRFPPLAHQTPRIHPAVRVARPSAGETPRLDRRRWGSTLLLLIHRGTAPWPGHPRLASIEIGRNRVPRGVLFP